MDLAEAREIAYEWHGGMSSPLYSFASTGKVWDTKHREGLLAEIREDIGYAEAISGSPEPARLRALEDFVKGAPLAYAE